jgi:hypothetical protein
MGTWRIEWNFDKNYYAPGSHACISLWLENTGETYLYLDEFSFQFDSGRYDLETVNGLIPSQFRKLLGHITFEWPKGIAGTQKYRIKYHMYEFGDYKWDNLGYYYSDSYYYAINVYPTPFYRVFISRRSNIEDRALTDPIVQTIREGGFETVSIGNERKVANDKIPQAIREEIRNAEAVVAIATLRHLDALNSLWRTFEELYSETGIRYGFNKPLLILKQGGVNLKGLPCYLNPEKYPIIEFDPLNIDELKKKLIGIIPRFREYIASKSQREFLNFIFPTNAAATVNAPIPSAEGYLIGSSTK